MTTPDIAGLCERLRAVGVGFGSRAGGYARAVMDAYGTLPVGQLYADLAEAADTLERQAAEIERVRGASDGLLAAMFECQDKLWIARCDSRDDRFRAAAKRAVEMANAARDKYRAALTGEDT